MRRGSNLDITQTSKPGYILYSALKADKRDSSGILPSGNTVQFYETYIADMSHFNEFFRDVAGYQNKGVSNIAAVSIDAVFSPYSTSYQSGDFPHFEVPTDTDNPNSITLNPFNPYNALYTSSGTFSPSGWANSGHNIMMASVGTGLGNVASNTNPVSLVFDSDFYQRGVVEASSIRSVGFRNPMILTGWGFNTDGDPVPADPNDSTKFHPQAFIDPKLWKSGPTDLRWSPERGVWVGGSTVKIYLVKTTNVYNPSCFSYEVQWSNNRNQYTRPNLTAKAYDSGNFPASSIYDPEYVSYTGGGSVNSGCYERLSFAGLEYPYYEAYIIRETNLDPAPNNDIYSIWAEDCQDCGHVSNECGTGTGHGDSATNKKILIENPLKQSLDVGDLAFTVATGRKKQVYSGGFTGGTGTGASGYFSSDSNGNLSFVVSAGGSDYTGAFATYTNPCVGLDLTVNSGIVENGTIIGSSGGFLANNTWDVTIIDLDAIAATEQLPIHWILQAEFKSHQVVSHVEASAGILQTVTQLLQTQGFSSCQHGGHDSSLVNSFL